MSHRWVRLDVDYFSNPKAIAAGEHGRALHLASICWSMGQLTDGRIPLDVVPRLVAYAGVPRATVERLVNVGLWLAEVDGYLVKDFLDHQPSRLDVERERAEWRERKRRQRRDPRTGRYS